MNLLPSNFDSLSPLDKRAAVVAATGLSWESYSALPGEQKVALLLSLKGVSVGSVTGEMLAASKSDSFWSGVNGYTKGLTSAGTILLIGGAALVIWLAVPSILAATGRVRRVA